MKKITLSLLVPMYLLTLQTATASESGGSKAWSRDDVINSVEALDMKREERSKRLEDSTKKILESRDIVRPVDTTEDVPTKELNDIPQVNTTEVTKSADAEKKVVKTDGMTMEIKEKEEKKAEPSISIEVSDKNASEVPAMIIEVKDESAVPQPKVSMELVKIEKVEVLAEVVEKKTAYPTELIEIKEQEK